MASEDEPLELEGAPPELTPEQITFLREFNIQLQNSMYAMLLAHHPKAMELNVPLNDMFLAIGSSVASIAYEQVRSKKQVSGLSIHQEGAIAILKEALDIGFGEKIDIIKSAEAMSAAGVNKEVPGEEHVGDSQAGEG